MGLLPWSSVGSSRTEPCPPPLCPPVALPSPGCSPSAQLMLTAGTKEHDNRHWDLGSSDPQPASLPSYSWLCAGLVARLPRECGQRGPRLTALACSSAPSLCCEGIRPPEPIVSLSLKCGKGSRPAARPGGSLGRGSLVKGWNRRCRLLGGRWAVPSLVGWVGLCLLPCDWKVPCSGGSTPGDLWPRTIAWNVNSPSLETSVFLEHPWSLSLAWGCSASLGTGGRGTGGRGLMRRSWEAQC